MAANNILTSADEARVNRLTAAMQEIDLGTSINEGSKVSDLASTSNGLGASLLGIEDSGANLAAANVEAALAEILNVGYTWKDKIFDAATELTIASGTAAVTQFAHTIDTESDAATDDLDSLTGGVAEEMVMIRPANAARSIVIKHALGANQFSCPGERDLTLEEVTDFALLYHDGTQWIVIAHSISKSGEIKELTQTIGHADLTAAATNEEIAVTGFPANAILIAGFIELDTDFSGGSVSALTASIGDTANADELAAAVNVFTGAGAGLKAGVPTAHVGFVPAYAPVVDFTATADNVVNLDAGSCVVHLFYRECSAATA